MTRVDFYIIGSTSADAAMDFSCRLAEKAWRSGHQILMHCADAQQAAELDDRLWQFKPESFLPHELGAAGGADIAICHAGDHTAMGDHCDLLINLAHDVPEPFSRFTRLAEIVDQREQSLAASRQRYSFYKRRGYPLHNHNVGQ